MVARHIKAFKILKQCLESYSIYGNTNVFDSLNIIRELIIS